MTQALASLSEHSSALVLCCYVNTSRHIQIVRISNISNWYFEKAVFPEQRLLFEAPPHAQLEIYTGTIASAILSQQICCQSLQVETS